MKTNVYNIENKNIVLLSVNENVNVLNIINNCKHLISIPGYICNKLHNATKITLKSNNRNSLEYIYLNKDGDIVVCNHYIMKIVCKIKNTPFKDIYISNKIRKYKKELDKFDVYEYINNNEHYYIITNKNFYLIYDSPKNGYIDYKEFIYKKYTGTLIIFNNKTIEEINNFIKTNDKNNKYLAIEDNNIMLIDIKYNYCKNINCDIINNYTTDYADLIIIGDKCVIYGNKEKLLLNYKLLKYLPKEFLICDSYFISTRNI